MSDKDLALNAIGDLPERVTLEQITQTVEFLTAVQKGLNQIEQGETVPHADVKCQLAQWLHE